MKQLVVTADDFGLAREVNEAVEEAHRGGILTAASLMVGGAAAADAVRRARAMPSLRVGLHIVLVDGRPILPAASIPDLVDGNGNFRDDMARAGAAIFFRNTVRRQLQDEIEAQFEAYRATGLALDHVNTHKHFHLHPTIAATILRVGQQHGMRSLRLPIEPRRVLALAEPQTATPPAYLTEPFARLLRWRLRSQRVRIPDAVFGLAWSGAMHVGRLHGLIGNLPSRLSEIYLHPASAGGFEGAAAGYRYADELAALTDRNVVAAVGVAEIRSGGFSDFV
jgi:hopanoid biosynthesis associated protein HpnK